MRREIEINGCVEITDNISADDFYDCFIKWVESNGWYFGGGINEIVDGHYINPDGTKRKYILS